MTLGLLLAALGVSILAIHYFLVARRLKSALADEKWRVNAIRGVLFPLMEPALYKALKRTKREGRGSFNLGLGDTEADLIYRALMHAGAREDSHWREKILVRMDRTATKLGFNRQALATAGFPYHQLFYK